MDVDYIIDIILRGLETMTPRIIASIIVLLASWLLVKILEKILYGVLRQVEMRYIDRILEIARVVVYGSAVVIVAAILFPETQAFSIILLIIGLAVIAMLLDVLRNLGAEFYVRSRGIIKKGDWIEVDGVFLRVIDMDTLGIIGETQRMERVFIPYTKLVNTIVVNRSTPIGLSIKVRVTAPATYSVEVVRDVILKSIKAVAEDLVSEPAINLASMKSDRLEFMVEMHIWNYRKLGSIVEELSRRIRETIPDAIIET
ncbi:mechanosensitive ion channel domain-containing protein [Desulfurococcus amylolyticus]|uniref:MscS Mechanosensitive ion channel n=1 Tax=Desulfurococcus amylolyticus DSM 16532 TaxID=768672 RepID=I3XRD3_DESAM|nr:mechanosensitive ion channel domain-containing protein [Desulfurococcus amylolyticus]AFL66507.1 MscS Mechanosensitive ion channel [Desulfurococcus amylolyticus DSM 16532]